MGWVVAQLGEHLPSMYKAIRSIPSSMSIEYGALEAKPKPQEIKTEEDQVFKGIPCYRMSLRPERGETASLLSPRGGTKN